MGSIGSGTRQMVLSQLFVAKIKVALSVVVAVLLLQTQSVFASAGCQELLSRGSWLQGRGVEVNKSGTCGLMEYQCVNLAYRQYQDLGWGNVGGLGNDGGAKDMWTILPGRGFERQSQGQISRIVSGDLIIHDSSVGWGYGHVAVVDTVAGSTVNAVEQNGSSNGRATYSYSSGSLSRSGMGGILGIIHAPANTVPADPPPAPPAPTAPSAPTISSIAQGNRSLTVNFSGPGSNGGSTITNYQYSINGGTSWVTRSPVSTASPIMITGLTYGETYPIRIRAVNAVGAGTASATVSSTPSSAGDFFPLAPTRVVDTRSGLGAVKIGANKTVTVALGSKVPANARAVALNITAVQPTADTFLTVWPAGETLPLSSNLNLRAREMRANAVIVGLGEDRAVSIFNSRGDTDVVVDITGYFISGFEGVTPSRVMDTRSGLGGSVFGPATQRTVKVAGVAGVPANASAVAVNVTATEPSKGTYLTVFPAGASRPLASTLNVAAGQTAANFAVVRVGDGGNITLYSDQGNVHGIIDVFGWFDTNGNLNPMTPQRVLDTRERTCGIRLGKGETRTVNVGRTNSQAVFVNVTAVDASEGTFVTVFPAGSSMPSTSNLNPMNSQAIPNFVLVGTGSGGEISIYNDRGNVEVIVDVLGFFDGPSRSGSRSNC